MKDKGSNIAAEKLFISYPNEIDKNKTREICSQQKPSFYRPTDGWISRSLIFLPSKPFWTGRTGSSTWTSVDFRRREPLLRAGTGKKNT